MRVEQIALPAVRFLVQRPRLLEVAGRFDRWGNMFGPDRYSNPYPLFERVRADGPVVFHAGYQYWFVTGFDEAQTVLHSPHTESGDQLDGFMSIRPYNQLSPATAAFFRKWLVFLDGKEHSRLRRIVSGAFTPRRIAALEPQANEIAADLVAKLANGQSVNIAQEYAFQLPISIISAMLGVPADRWPWVQRVAAEATKLLDPFHAFDPRHMSETMAEMFGYFTALADARRHEPRDDLITALVQADDDGSHLDEAELMAMIGFLLFAGFETTAGLLGNSIVALAEHPDQRRLIRDQPDLWPNATEELIRWDPPLQVDGRTTTSDLHLGDVTIPAGQNILIFLGAANRDPRTIDRPNELHLDRESPQSISFGHGAHHCLGAALARMETRIGMRHFVEAFGDYTIDHHRTVWKQSVSLRGPRELWVKAGPNGSTE